MGETELKYDPTDDKYYPCALCMSIHAFEHVCDEQLDIELVHAIQQEFLLESILEDK